MPEPTNTGSPLLRVTLLNESTDSPVWIRYEEGCTTREYLQVLRTLVIGRGIGIAYVSYDRLVTAELRTDAGYTYLVALIGYGI